MSRLGPVGYWSRLSGRSQMVALFVLVSGLLAVVAIASASRPLAGRWGTSSTGPRGELHCSQVTNFNFVTGAQVPQYQCTYVPLKQPKWAGHGPCPAAFPDCGDYEQGVAGPSLRGPITGRVVEQGKQPRRASASPGGLWLLIAAGSLVGLLLLTVGARRLVQWRLSTGADELPPQEANSPAAEENNPAPEEGTAFALAADESLAELRIEGDATRAIIGCYAQMERSLARAGMARRPSEAPLEYLTRVLAAVAPIAGRTLTDLYERAKFSRQPMNDRDKNRAIEALEALRHAAVICEFLGAEAAA